MNAKDARTATQETREALAARLYSPRTVREAIAKASGSGFGTVTLRQDVPVRLEDTEAAQAMRTWLEGEGFQVTWQEAITKGKGGAVYSQAVIRWADHDQTLTGVERSALLHVLELLAESREAELGGEEPGTAPARFTGHQAVGLSRPMRKIRDLQS